MSKISKTKKLAALFAAVTMALSVTACGGNNEQPEETTPETTESVTETEAPAESKTTIKTTTAPKVTTTTTTTLPPLPVMETYEEDYAVNEDMIGWINIYIPNENDIDEPVVQGEDNKYYLTHDFQGNEVVEGAIFADFKCTFTTRTRPANTILYGHNMASGKSFAKLTRYCPWYASGYNRWGTSFSLNQYITSPTVSFNTVWEEGTYKVFAAIFVNTEEKNGEVFKYYKQRTIANEGEFYDYLGNIMDRSLFYTDVDLEYGDELLTLSTCYYPLGKANADTRFVVFARRLRDGESAEVDTSKAYINPDPLYFDYMYQVYGGSWGGRNWDTSKIKGFDEYYKTHDTTAPAAE